MKKLIPISALALALFVACSSNRMAESRSSLQTAPDTALQQEEINAIARDAYTYFYPLITMDITRRQMTNVERPTGQFAPMNTLLHMREFPPANLRVVVRPNFDTLYTSAWLDLTDGPMVVSAPETNGRYYLLPMLDMWTDVFASPGKRTTGTGAIDIAVVPPGWNGDIPKGMSVVIAPTPYVWMIGRTQTNGASDYANVHKIQDGMRLTRLADWGKGSKPVVGKVDPTVDMKTPPLEQVNAMPASKYFSYAAELMRLHPGHIDDQTLLLRLRRIGFEPGKSFDFAKADPKVQRALDQSATTGPTALKEKMGSLATVTNGWEMNTSTMGVYGTYFTKRAIVAMLGLGANLPEDAIYPMNLADSTGKPVTGDKSYVMHFAKDQIPPVNAFWSLTMYDDQGFQVANELNRFAIGDRDKLAFNKDGSLDLYIQHKNPGKDKESNWLPAPATGKLGMTMRLYAPKAAALDGTWAPPPVKRR